MTEGIIIALITGVCAVVGTLIGQWAMFKKSRAEDAAERARLDERTDQRLRRIEEKLDEQQAATHELAAQVKEHNGLKQDIAALRADVKNMQGRG